VTLRKNLHEVDRLSSPMLFLMHYDKAIALLWR
jgi:hypothetical protein